MNQRNHFSGVYQELMDDKIMSYCSTAIDVFLIGVGAVTLFLLNIPDQQLKRFLYAKIKF